MLNYLSIGKVAQIRNINAKSLRYYDEIGVLKPAFTDPYTGYRYYKEEQMVLLDIIQFFIEFGIPLKTFNDYFNEDGGFDLEKFFKTGQRLATEKKNRIERTLKRIDLTLPAIEQMDDYRDKSGFYMRQIEERHVLTLPVHANPSLFEFERQLPILVNMATESNVSASFSCGIIADCIPKESDNGTDDLISDDYLVNYFIYILIDHALPGHPNYRQIPADTFKCKITTTHNIYDLTNIDVLSNIHRSYQITPPRPLTYFASTLVSKVHHADAPKIEIQLQP